MGTGDQQDGHPQAGHPPAGAEGESQADAGDE